MFQGLNALQSLEGAPSGAIRSAQGITFLMWLAASGRKIQQKKHVVISQDSITMLAELLGILLR